MASSVVCPEEDKGTFKCFAEGLKRQDYVRPWVFANPLGHYMQLMAYSKLRDDAALLCEPDEHIVQTHADGGQSCITLWRPRRVTRQTPVLVLFHTLTSRIHAFSAVVEFFVKQAGWLVAILNKRGHHCPLTSDRVHLLGDDDETLEQLQELAKRYPHSPAYAYGSSCGAIMLSRFLGKHPTFAWITAACCVATGFDMHMVSRSSAVMLQRLKSNIVETFLAHVQPEWPRLTALRAVCQDPASSMHDMLQACFAAGAPSHGGSGGSEHGAGEDESELDPSELFELKHTAAHFIPHIRIPILFINSEDDPLFSWSEEYILVLQRAPYAVVVVTKYGSHACYIENSRPWLELSWADRMAHLFFRTVAMARAPSLLSRLPALVGCFAPS